MQTHYLILDYETFYSKDYSLKKLTPVEYVLDPRFEVVGVAAIEGINGQAQWLDPTQFLQLLLKYRRLQLNGDKVVVITHNALFDCCILRWRYGFLPDLMIDTLGMARALVQAFTKSCSLAALATYYGLAPKGGTVANVIGMTRQDIIRNGLWDAYGEYSCHDAELCRDIFLRMKVDFPKQEYLVMDTVLRMAVQPRFKLNSNLLAQYHNEVIVEKDGLLQKAGLFDRDQLMSDEMFALLLRAYGVEPETKISFKTGKETFAFAKTDQFMADLEEHPDPRVQALAAARLGHKSTIEETRSKRMLDISLITWPGKIGTGLFPIPLRYAGAHTHRLSGDWKLNAQNWARGGTIRRAVEAPPGYTVVTCDASQIEARLVAWFCGQDDLVQDFANRVDIYSKFAGEEVYHYPVDKKNNPEERFVGKQVILGCGFGVGGKKFCTMINTLSRLQLGKEMNATEDWAKTVVNAYRRRYSKIKDGWDFFTQMFPQLASTDTNVQWGPITFHKQYIEGPTGLKLFYHNLRQEVVKGSVSWVCDYAGRRKFLHGGLMMENTIQHLARCFIFEVALAMRKRFPAIQLAHQVHDELIYLVPNAQVAEFKQALLDQMRTPPAWAPGLPVDGEAGEGANYGEAK
jgi:DNA polymerase